MSWRSCAWWGLLLASTVARGQELPATLGLTEALQRFDRVGYDVLLAEAAVESARADTLTAAALINPSVLGSALVPVQTTPRQCADPSCSAVLWTAQVGDNGALFDVVFGKRGARRRVAEAAYAAARLNRQDALRTLHFQVKSALVEAARAARALEATLTVQASLERIVELNRVRYSSGAISEADLAKVETETLEAQADVDRARLALTQAKVMVAFLLGVRGPVPPFDVDLGLLADQGPRGAEALTLDGLTHKALAQRPDLKAAAAQRARADASLDVARRAVLPDVQLAPQVSAYGSGTLPNAAPYAGFAAQVQVPLFYRFEGEVARARAEQRTQAVAEDKVRAQVVADVEVAFAAFTSARHRLERMNGGLLARAERTRDLIRFQYEKGAGSLLELLDAERQLVSVRLEYVQDLADYWTALFQLEQAAAGEVT